MFKDGVFRCDQCCAPGPLIYVEGLEVCEHLETRDDFMQRANREYKIKLADIYSDLDVAGVKDITDPDAAWAVIVKKRNLKP